MTQEQFDEKLNQLIALGETNWTKDNVLEPLKLSAELLYAVKDNLSLADGLSRFPVRFQRIAAQRALLYYLEVAKSRI